VWAPRGDAARYNERIATGRFATRTFHIGYIALGYVLRPLLPGDTDWLMNLMTLVLGTGGASACTPWLGRSSVRPPRASSPPFRC